MASVLVVDDDPSVVKLLETVLKKQGYAVDTAQDGLDALVKLKHNPPDLVVLDIMLPEINGYDICYHLRFNKDFAQIPILLVTEREQELDDRIGKRINIVYLAKPIKTEDMLAKIKLLLSAT